MLDTCFPRLSLKLEFIIATSIVRYNAFFNCEHITLVIQLKVI